MCMQSPELFHIVLFQGLQPINDGLDFIFGLPQSFLKAADQLVFLAFFVKQIVIGELGVFGFQLALDLFPIAFNPIFGCTHDCMVLIVNSL